MENLKLIPTIEVKSKEEGVSLFFFTKNVTFENLKNVEPNQGKDGKKGTGNRTVCFQKFTCNGITFQVNAWVSESSMQEMNFKAISEEFRESKATNEELKREVERLQAMLKSQG